MFGQGYKRIESKKIADDGEYVVVLSGVKEREKNGYRFLEFYFTYRDGQDMLPNSFSLFENRPEQGQKGFEDFCRRATQIFDCFDLNPKFDEKTMASWVGHSGEVVIGKDKNGFAVVKKFFPSQTSIERANMQNAQSFDFGRNGGDVF